MDLERNVPFDVRAYEARVKSRPCFICAIVARDPEYALEQIVYEDDRHLAFLSGYPPCPATSWSALGGTSSTSYATWTRSPTST
ncbi:hypothetical protein [Nonomuraea jiangxiensis]|uniref:Uncharacterized protein n=1 Tax=Nonomuraea jiangxiensis TaxID=633440 RepID=A0A1G8ZBI1_9ACTN|nr:hypothetical protein [Nonomuraea jiangxiensis]SDK12387.1 hypothetical protein SAMN05421869_11416 [Nonomuraea jiangxiensis]